MKAYSQKMIHFEWNSDIKLTKLGTPGKRANKSLKTSERMKAKRDICKTLKNISKE